MEENKLSIKKFKDEVKSFQKSSFMQVEIFPPEKLKQKHSYEIENYKYTCEASKLPGYTFKFENRNIANLTTEMPVGFELEKLELTFLCRSDMRERKLFDDWFHVIQDPETLRFEYYDNYVGKIKVSTIDNIENRSYSIEYENAYPSLMTSQTLQWSESQILRLVVSFSYEKFTPIQVNKKLDYNLPDDRPDWIKGYKNFINN